jgi:hypothetical protein
MESIEIPKFDPKVQEYHVVDAYGKPTGQVLDFNQLVTLTLLAYDKKTHWHTLSKQLFDETTKGYRNFIPMPVQSNDVYHDACDLDMDSMRNLEELDLGVQRVNMIEEQIRLGVQELPKFMFALLRDILIHIDGLSPYDLNLFHIELERVIFATYGEHLLRRRSQVYVLALLLTDYGSEFFRAVIYSRLESLQTTWADPDKPLGESTSSKSKFPLYKVALTTLWNHPSVLRFTNILSCMDSFTPFISLFCAIGGMVLFHKAFKSIVKLIFPITAKSQKVKVRFLKLNLKEYIHYICDKNKEDVHKAILDIGKFKDLDDDTLMDVDEQFLVENKDLYMNFLMSDDASRDRENLSTDPQSFNFNDRLAKGKKINHSFKDLRTSMKPQGSDAIDSSGSELIKSCVNTNVYLIFMEKTVNSGIYYQLGYVFMVRGRIMLMPFHFLCHVAEVVRSDPCKIACKISIRKTTEMDSHGYLISVRDLFDGSRDESKLKDFDAILVELPRHVQPFRDKLDLFIKDSDIDFLDPTFKFLMPLKRTDQESFILNAKLRTVPLPVDSDTTGFYEIPRSFEYDCFTSKGDCGALFCILNSATPKRKLAGIHVAGLGQMNLAFSTIITQEMLIEDLKLFGPQIIESDSSFVATAQNGSDDIYNQFNFIGKVSKKPSKVLKTTLIPSKLHGKIAPILTGPALLRDSELRDLYPMRLALTPYCSNKQYLYDDELKIIFRELPRPSNRKKRFILNLRDVLHGLDYDSSHSGISSSTSAGYPMNTYPDLNLKKEYYSALESGGDVDKVFSKIQVAVDGMLELYKSGIRPEIIFTDNLKDERRPLAKLAIGSTRVFNGCPFLYLILFKMYFGAFSRSFMDDRISNYSVVGVNPYSSEWDILTRKLIQRTDSIKTIENFKSFHSVKVGAGDYKRFDASEIPQLHYLILDLVNEWYDDENSSIRSLLWLELVNSRHLNEDHLYEWCSSLPSGHPFTIVANSYYNIAAFIASFNYLRDKSGYTGSFRDHVFLQVCGDDNIFTVTPYAQQFFHEGALPEAMARFGLIYTREDKLESTSNFRDLSEVEFLKRGFRYDDYQGRFLAPLRLSVILEIPCWTRAGGKHSTIAVSNAWEAVKELSLHSEDVFIKYSSIICNLVAKHYPDYLFPQIGTLDYRVVQESVISSDYKFC